MEPPTKSDYSPCPTLAYFFAATAAALPRRTRRPPDLQASANRFSNVALRHSLFAHRLLRQILAEDQDLKSDVTLFLSLPICTFPSGLRVIPYHRIASHQTQRRFHVANGSARECIRQSSNRRAVCPCPRNP